MDRIKTGTAHTSYTALISSMTGALLTNPTLAAGDVQLSLDGGNFNNVTALPTVTPAAQCQVQFVLAALEVGTNVVICIRFKDQTSPSEWDSQMRWFTTTPSPADLTQILGAAITGTAAQIVAAFTKLFDVVTPVFTSASINQTGDTFAKFTGITLLANWLRGLARSDVMDATAKTQLNAGGGTYDEVTDSLEGASVDLTPVLNRLPAVLIGGRIDASIGAMAANTLTASALATDAVNEIQSGLATAAVLADVHTDVAALSLAWSGAAIAASVASGVISQIRGDVWNIALTGLAVNTGYSAIDFSIKRKDSDADADALVHIRLSAPPIATDGLLRLNGADPGDLAAGSITVVSATAITIHLDADKTAALAAMAGLVYDVQYLFTATTGPTTVEKGIFTVTADVSRATA